MESIDCAEMMRRHPELIMVSNDPLTWEGMLSVTTNFNEKSKIRLKLTLPNFPRFKNASIKFGKNSAALFRKDFNERTKDLLKNASSVISFLKQLQILIGETWRSRFCGTMRIDDYSVISELEAVLCSPCEVKLSSNHGWNLIELVLNNISMKLERNMESCDTWIIISCDLAQLQGSELEVGSVVRLRDAANKLVKQVESLGNVWTHLEDIDRNCWVIDPLVPKPYHLYRRIRITKLLSIMINVNPSDPRSLPGIKLLGSDSETSKYRDILSDNLELWNSEGTIADNLLLLLNLEEFPKPTSNVEEKTIKEDGFFNNDECGICFSLELNEDELPDRICNNEKCGKHFHNACLSQWLQAIPGNRVVFNQLHGDCPFCGQNISCRIE